MSQKNLYTAITKSMLGRYAVYAANLLSMVILARLFTPELFGTVAAIQVFAIFFQMLSEAGLGPAIINVTKLEKIDRDGLFGLTILIGVVLAMIFYSCSPVILNFYKIPRIDEIIPFATVVLFFSTVTIVPNAFLLREQSFFSIANSNLAGEIVSTLCTLALINKIDPLYALSSKAPIKTLISFFGIYYFSKNTTFGRPYFGIKFSAIKPLLSFSMYQLGFNFINYFSRNLDNILVGKVLGSSVLGIYDKAYQLMTYPLMLLTFAMTPAIQPAIKKYADDIAKVEQIHKSFTFKLSLMGAVVGLVMFFGAEKIVLLMLGKQWTEVIPIIQILSLAIPVQIVLSTSGSFFQALNRTDLLFLSGFLAALVTVSAISFGIYQKDIIVLSWSLVLAFQINFIQAYLILYHKIFHQGAFKFFLAMTPSIILIMGAIFIFYIYNPNTDFFKSLSVKIGFIGVFIKQLIYIFN